MEFIPKIIINLNMKQTYNKIPIVVFENKLTFGIKSKGTSLFKIQLMEAPKDIQMYIRALNPNKEKFTISPTKVDTDTFLVDLQDEQKNINGKYPFEIVIKSGEQEMTIYQGHYRIKEWLDNRTDINIDYKEVK